MLKTKNNNFVILDRGCPRFIDSQGNHIRWIDFEEFIYLERVLQISEAPKPKNFPKIGE